MNDTSFEQAAKISDERQRRRSLAIKLYNAGVEAANNKINQQNVDHAYKAFMDACYADPIYGLAFYQAGNNESDRNMLAASVALYRRALECDNSPQEKAKTLVNLGWRLHCLGMSEEGHKASLEAVSLDSSLAYGWLNLSMTSGMLGEQDFAAECGRKAFMLDPKDPICEMAYAFSLLFNHQFALGLKHFERRFEYKLTQYAHYPYPRWSGEPDKTVFLVSDQGMGDTLSYSRFVRQAAKRANFLHICVQPELMRLFAHAFADLKNINFMPQPGVFPAADYWTTFVSLPFALGFTDKEIRTAKNIEAPIYGLPRTWKVPDRKLHIGIAWAGSPLNEIDQHRNIPVHHFFDLYRVPGIQLYAFQVDGKKDQLHQNGGAALVRDLSGYIRDVVDTISLLQDIDLVICCESALGHIAALAGKECWIPYSYLGRDYRIGLDGSDRLWTPRHRIFPQGASRDWGPAFESMIYALKDRMR